jgi:hypothetical protein
MKMPSEKDRSAPIVKGITSLIRWNHRGDKLAVGDFRRGIVIIDRNSQNIIKILPYSNITQFRWSNDDSQLIFTASELVEEFALTNNLKGLIEIKDIKKTNLLSYNLRNDETKIIDKNIKYIDFSITE